MYARDHRRPGTTGIRGGGLQSSWVTVPMFALMDQRNGSIQTNDLAYLVGSDSGELIHSRFRDFDGPGFLTLRARKFGLEPVDPYQVGANNDLNHLGQTTCSGIKLVPLARADPDPVPSGLAGSLSPYCLLLQ
jgi:hypothetical protein